MKLAIVLGTTKNNKFWRSPEGDLPIYRLLDESKNSCQEATEKFQAETGLFLTNPFPVPYNYFVEEEISNFIEDNPGVLSVEFFVGSACDDIEA